MKATTAVAKNTRRGREREREREKERKREKKKSSFFSLTRRGGREPVVVFAREQKREIREREYTFLQQQQHRKGIGSTSIIDKK